MQYFHMSNDLLIIFRWLIMLLSWGLYEQLTSHFFLWWLISTKKLSTTGKSWLSNLMGISSRTYSIIPPPLILRSNPGGEWRPSIKNWASGKPSPNLDTVRISMEPLTCSQKRSNLFLKELMFKYQFVHITNTNVLKRFFNIWLRNSRTIRHAIFFTKWISVIIKNSIALNKTKQIFAKKLLPFLFRCNFLIPRWLSLTLAWSIKLRFFWAQ